jgi:hypothetical protein
MRHLSLYLQQIFCKHEFETQEAYCEIETLIRNRKGIRESKTCKKCGYHIAFWRFK